VNGSGFKMWASEAEERALFTRRARALPAPELPSLAAVLAAADARGAAARAAFEPAPSAARGGARPRGVVTAMLVAAALAAACVCGVVATSRSGSGASARTITADFDAGTTATTSAAAGVATRGDTCEPDGIGEDDQGPTCGNAAAGAPQASFVLASTEPHTPTCTQAEPAPSPGAPLTCERDLVCMP
jgi:hypothetical protein